ncbi:MAG TPA: VC0807 family protein [Nocardioidaceae bacterium]|nr:VC0807 family protein [Nocardioidaceae bacterium]
MQQRQHPHVVTLPRPLRLGAHIVAQLAEAVLLPLVIFYVLLMSSGLHWALVGALGWAYLVVAVRLVRGERPSALLAVTAAMATLKVGVAGAANSAMVYFLQPTLATYVFAAALLLTVPLDRPLIQRLAHDFCPLPPDVIRSVPVRRLFQRLSLLWAAVLIVNASVTLGLLLTTPTVLSVPVATAASVPVFLAGLGASCLWFRRSIRDGGFVLAWASD